MTTLHSGAFVPQYVWCPYLRAGRLLHVDTLERDGHGLAVYALQRLPDSKIVDPGALLSLALHGEPVRRAPGQQASPEAVLANVRPCPRARQRLARAVAAALRSLKLLFT